MIRRMGRVGVVAALSVLGAAGGFLYAHLQREAPTERTVTISARKYAYEPPVLHVNRGDRIRLRFVAQDVTHGFYLEGYDLDARARPHNPTFWVRRPSTEEQYREVEKVEFVANHSGKFRYRCSSTCGYMHPFMQGELIVDPNYLYPTSLGTMVAFAAALLLVLPGVRTRRAR